MAGVSLEKGYSLHARTEHARYRLSIPLVGPGKWVYIQKARRRTVVSCSPATHCLVQDSRVLKQRFLDDAYHSDHCCCLLGGCTKLMAPSCAQVQCSWGENRNSDTADNGGEETTQHGPDLGTVPGDKAFQDRYTHTEQDIPSRPSWAGSHAVVCVSPGLVEGLRKRLLPTWCAPLAHGLSLLLVAVAVAVSGWIGASFPPSVSVMWLLSSSSSFLASFLGWEPLKVRGLLEGRDCRSHACQLTALPLQVLLEALYFSLVAKRLHPDEDDTLVESPAVTPVSERVPRVRPPHGFALFLAKEEARKVKRLHDMLKVSPGHCSTTLAPVVCLAPDLQWTVSVLHLLSSHYLLPPLCANVHLRVLPHLA